MQHFRNINELPFEDLFKIFFDETTIEKNKQKMKPFHDIIENDKEYILQMYLAGIKKEDIEIDFENDILKIKANRKPIEGVKYKHKESFTGVLENSFTVPKTINIDKLDVTFVDGVLNIVLPKTNEKNKTKITIK